MATTILLVRHGQTEWNESSDFVAGMMSKLNSTGSNSKKDRSADSQSLETDGYLSSPLKRAVQTCRKDSTGLRPKSGP